MELEQIKQFVAKQGRNAAIAANFSGGKDSARMLGYLRKHFPDTKTYVVFADTGFEHVKPVSAEEWSQRAAGRYGLELHVVRNPNKTYLQMVERRGKFPSAGQRQCTSDLKRGPIEKFIRHLPEKFILNCTGIRASESANRAKQDHWKLNGGLSKAGRIVWNWMPIFHETLAEVLEWHWTNEIPLHPVYVEEYHRDGSKGGYLRRLSCRVCIFSTGTDIRKIHQHDPEAFAMVASLEQRIGFTMKNSKSLFEIIGQGDAGEQYGSEEITPPCAA